MIPVPRSKGCISAPDWAFAGMWGGVRARKRGDGNFCWMPEPQEYQGWQEGRMPEVVLVALLLFWGPILSSPFPQTSSDLNCFPSCLRPLPQGLSSSACSDWEHWVLITLPRPYPNFSGLCPTSSGTFPKALIQAGFAWLGSLKAEPEHAWVQVAYFGDNQSQEAGLGEMGGGKEGGKAI